MLKYQGNILKIANSTVDYNAPVPPQYPSDMDFIYLANDFDGNQIPNIITTSDMGPYLKAGTLTKNGTGSSCYLSNANTDTNYLYINLTTNRLNAMKADNGTYTYFCRVISTVSGTGGIITWRYSNDGYVYMFRSVNGVLQVHVTTGYTLDATNFSLATDNVYKLSVSGNTYLAKNLSSGSTWSNTYSASKTMGSVMTSFRASSYGGESEMDRFYGIAGIARATTDEEDAIIKDILMNQSV